jgi:hypothetical protein
LIESRQEWKDNSTIVKTLAGSIVMLAASFLVGCGSSTGTRLGELTAANVAGNWQIQSSANSLTASPQGVLLLGALKDDGNGVSGTFRFTNLARQDACGVDQVVTVAGAVKSGNTLNLVSSALPNGTTIKISLKMLGAQPYSGIGTVEVDGPTCAVASASAIGSQVASTTGTFVGTLSPGASGTHAAGSPGTATIVLKQSVTPGEDGRFSTTGTLSYQFGGCSGSAPLNGSMSGVGMSFWDLIFTSGGEQEVKLTGTINLAATNIQAGYLLLSPAPCSADLNSSAVFNGAFHR